MRNKLWVIMGPTASGKTDYAIQLAKEKGGAVVSADSRQVYAGMDIGTAKPSLAVNHKYQSPNMTAVHDVLTPDMVDGVEHYLFNIRTPDDQLTLAEWQAAAFKVIDNILEQGRTPLLAGGTMLYVDSIIYNYDLPRMAVDEELRRELEQKDTNELYQELAGLDKEATEFIERQNKRRIIRALEVIKGTGRPFSELRKKKPPRYEVRVTGLNPGWPKLDNRIEKRIRKMIDNGLADEVEGLQKKYGKDLVLLKTINYKQMAEYLAGDIGENEMLEKMVRVNKRYARRQMSWWRRNEVQWLNC